MASGASSPQRPSLWPHLFSFIPPLPPLPLWFEILSRGALEPFCRASLILMTSKFNLKVISHLGSHLLNERMHLSYVTLIPN